MLRNVVPVNSDGRPAPVYVRNNFWVPHAECALLRVSLVECDACTCIDLRVVLCLDGCQGSHVCLTIDVPVPVCMYNMKKDEIVPLFGAHARLHVFTNIARVDTRTNIIGRCTVRRRMCLRLRFSISHRHDTQKHQETHRNTHTHKHTQTQTLSLSLSLSLYLSIYLSNAHTNYLSHTLTLTPTHTQRKSSSCGKPECVPNQSKSQSASRTNYFHPHSATVPSTEQDKSLSAVGWYERPQTT